MGQKQHYMERALQLAERGRGLVSPNPMVGAVIVKKGVIISQGYHRRFGAPHAEIMAIRDARQDVRGASIYINLEPCCHQGKTPPCTDAIIKAGIKKVYIGIMDPNPLVSGKGIRQLRQAGIQVQLGLLKERCRQLNEAFITYHKKQRPFIIVKWAMSTDGRTSTNSGESKWISSGLSRQLVQKWRSWADAIMVGAGTVIIDNPALTVRLKSHKARPPLRIVVDKELEIPLDSKCLNTRVVPTLIFTASASGDGKKRALVKKGVKILEGNSRKGTLDLTQLMHRLWEMEIQSVLVEGGRRLCGSLFSQGLVDKLIIFIAPKLLGGRDNTAPIVNWGVESISDAVSLSRVNTKLIGKDIVIEAYPVLKSK